MTSELDVIDLDNIVESLQDGGDPRYDFNEDGTMDGRDIDRWLEIASDAHSVNYQRGDANLDGVVDANDLSIWRSFAFRNLPRIR